MTDGVKVSNTEIEQTFDVWRRQTNDAADRLNSITQSFMNDRITLTGNVEVNSTDMVVDTTTNRVGIGTSTPTVKLDIVGETNISADLKVNTDDFVVDSATSKVGINTATPSETLDVVGKTLISDDLMISGAVSNVLFVDTSATSVGINTDTPSAAVSLEINGDTLLQNTDELQFKNNGGTPQVVLSVNTSDTTILQGSGGTESVAIKSSDGISRLIVNEAGVTSVTANAVFDTDTLYVDATNDRVGVNNGAPTEALDVTGKILSSTEIQGVTLTDGTATLTAGDLIANKVTLSDDLLVSTGVNASNTLFVDVSENKVGVNNDAPTEALDVTGKILSSTEIQGVTLTDGNATMNSGTVTATAFSGGTFGGTTGTFSDDLVVDTDTLFVDVSENKVGINNAVPSQALDVTGNIDVSGVIKVSGSSTAGQYLKVDASGNGMEYVDIQAVLSGNGVVSKPLIAPFPNANGNERDVTMWQSNTVITGNTNMLTYDTGTGQLNVKSNSTDSAIIQLEEQSGSLNTGRIFQQNGIFNIESGTGDQTGSGDVRFSGFNASNIGSNFQVRYGAAWQNIMHQGNGGTGSNFDADLLDGQQGSEYSRLVASTADSTDNQYSKIVSWIGVNPYQSASLVLLIKSDRSSTPTADHIGSCSATVAVTFSQNDSSVAPFTESDVQILSYSSHDGGSVKDIIQSITLTEDGYNGNQELWIRAGASDQIFTVYVLTQNVDGPDLVFYDSASWQVGTPSGSGADTGTKTVTAIEQSADFLPKVDSAYDLGSNSIRWATIYGDTLTGTLNNSLTLNTTGTGVSGSATYNNSGAATFTVASNATDSDVVGTIVSRNGTTGGFSAGPIIADSLTATTGSIILQNTGRIQGIDTVSAVTDAANKSYVDSVNLDFLCDTGGALDVNLSTETFTIAGSSGIDTVGSGETLTIELDLTELTDMTAATVASDELILLDVSVAAANKQRRKPFSEIDLSIFNTIDQIALGTDTTGNYVATIADAGSGRITVLNSGTETAGITLDIATDAVTMGTHTAGNYVATITGGAGIASSGATSGETIDHSLSVDLTDTSVFNSDGTVSTAVVLDGSGNFSAGTITAALNGTATNATDATNATNFNVEADNTTDAPHYVIFANSVSGNQRPNSDTSLTYNPNSNRLNVGDVNITNVSGLLFNGTAVTATAAQLNLLVGSVAGSIVNDKAVIYNATGDIKANDVEVSSKIFHSGDINNYFQFNAADEQIFVTDGATVVTINGEGLRVNKGAAYSDADVLSDTGNVDINMDSANHFHVTLTTTAARVINNPTNMDAGKIGTIKILRSTTTTLGTITFGTGWRFPNGDVPDIATDLNTDGGSNNYGYLDYYCDSTSTIRCNWSGVVKAA